MKEYAEKCGDKHIGDANDRGIWTISAVGTQG